MFNLEKPHGGGSMNVYKQLKGGCEEDGAMLFSVVPSDKKKDNEHKLKQRTFCLCIRKHFLTQQLMKN